MSLLICTVSVFRLCDLDGQEQQKMSPWVCMAKKTEGGEVKVFNLEASHWGWGFFSGSLPLGLTAGIISWISNAILGYIFLKACCRAHTKVYAVQFLLCIEQGSATWHSIHVCSTYMYSTIVSYPYCCDTTRNLRAPNAVRRSGAPHMFGLMNSKTF
jgi:hypothetical protein